MPKQFYLSYYKIDEISIPGTSPYAIIRWLQVRGCPGPVMDFFFFLLLFNILSEVNINILGLYNAFWYTGSAFTKYFNHNKKTTTELIIVLIF